MIAHDDILTEAQSLLQTDMREARCRTVASRAYYAAYHAVLPIAKQHGFDPNNYRGMGSHKALLKFLAASRHPELQDLHDDMATLRQRRMVADYELAKRLLAVDVRDSVALADALIKGL